MTLLLLLLAAATAAPDATLSAGERTPVIGVVLTPREGQSPFAVTEVRQALDEVIERETPMRVLPVDPALERCAGSPSCIVENLGSSTDGAQAPRLLALVALRSDGYVSCRFFDLPRALVLLRGHPDLSSDRDALDGLVFSDATVAEGPASAPTDLRALSDALRERVRAARENIGDVPDLGAIDLSVDLSNAVIELDGRTLGLSNGAPIRITDVRGGTRRLGIVHPDFPPYAADVVVAPGEVAALDIVMDPPFVFPHADVWPPLALLGLGATFVAVGASRAGELSAVCTLADPTACPSDAGFPRLVAGEGAGSGPLAAPLGYSLGASALAYVISRRLSDDDAPWWWAPALALGAGLVTYTVSELVAAPE